jgi:hypothetical protein
MQSIKGFADSASGMSPNISPSKGKLSVTQQSKLNAEIEAKVIIMKRNATICCQEMYQFMADVTAERLTKPRKVKIFGYKNITLEDVTKKNFADVKLVAKAIPSEDVVQNKAIKQKAAMEIYTVFKDDPKIPGQLALRRGVAKTFDIDPDQLEAIFTQEEQPKPAEQVPPTTDNSVPEVPKAPTDASALLSATQKGAQVNVPKSL